MKKLGNLSLLALLAVGLALVFGGCRRDITALGSPVTGVTIIDPDPDSAITVGGTKQLFANVSPDNAINKDVTWYSSDTGVATVEQDGTVTGVGEGTAVITVVTDDGGFTAFCVVTVEGNQGDSNPPGGGDGTENPSDQASEKVFVENAEGLENCSVLAKYDDLKAVYDEHQDATLVLVVKNTADASRTGWGCGSIFTSTDPNDAYNTQDVTLLDDYKPENLDAGGTEEISCTLKSVMGVIKEGGCVSYNLYNGIVAIKAYAKW